MSIDITPDGPSIEISGSGASIEVNVTTGGGSSGGGGATDLDDLTDVVITAAASGDILRHNGTNWVDTPGTDHYEAAGAVAAHSSDTTSVHGIADTSALETTTGAQAKVDTHVNDTTAAHAASAISVDASGFNGNLGTGDDTVQKVAQKLDDLVTGGSETLPATIIDAKGDLIVGSAADTPVRVAVGANRRVLRAASGETSGVKWGLPDQTFPTPTGIYTSGVIASVNYGAISVSSNFIICTLLWTDPDRTIDRIATFVTSPAASATARIALHRMDGTNGFPGTQIVAHSGTLDCSSGGLKAATVSAIGEGWVWAVHQSGGGNASFRTIPTSHCFGPLTDPSSSATRSDAAFVARTDAAIPSDLTSTTFSTLTTNYQTVMIRYA
jgi:hypothetical protein